MNYADLIEKTLYISALLSGGYLLLMLFSILLYNKEEYEVQKELPPVSVIIAAHNELENLRNYLPKILHQQYPVFEVIVACDRTSDESLAYLNSLVHPSLKIIDIKEVPADFNPKKYALTQAIEAAAYTHLLLTDADCYPASDQWIRLMAQQTGPERRVCLGLSFYKGNNSFLHRFIRFETLFTAVQYAGWAILGKPYMAVGRNLLYTRELFINNSGFGEHRSRLGGDDDLLIQRIADEDNTIVCMDPESFTRTQPAASLSAWWKQKHRHLNAGKKYGIWVLAGLGIYPVFSLLYYAISVYYICSLDFPLVYGLYFLRTCIFIITFASIGNKWRLSTTWLILPLLEIIYLFYLLSAGCYNLVVPIKKWK